MPTLTIQLPGLPSVEHIVREDAITLGRMKGNSISLNDSSVSLSHAKITRIGNDFFLKDLNSTNGTMLNGQSITEARLRDGDQLKFGEVIAYFRPEPLSPPVSAPASASPEPAPMPKPIAQSVTTSALLPSAVPPARLTPSAVPPVSPKPVTAIRSFVPAPPPTRRRSLRLPLFILAGGAVLAAVVFLTWNNFKGRPVPTTTAPSVAHVIAPNKLPANNIAAVKTAPAANASPAPAKVVALPARNHQLDDLMMALKSPDVAERRRAAAAIYNLGTDAKDALPDLPAVLADADPEVRMWTALSLVHNNVFDQAAILILVQTLKHENPTLRQVACLSLAMVPYTEAEKATVVPALVDTATNDANADVVNDALTALKIIAPDLVVGK